MAIRTACVALLLLTGATAAHAYDLPLSQALDRVALPLDDVQGMIRTTTTVKGGDRPEVETKMIDPRKEPKKALPSYEELQGVIGPDSRLVSREAGRTTYAFTTRHVPRGLTQAGEVTIDMDGKDDDSVFDGTAVVRVDANGLPYVSHVDLRLADPGSSLIAKVKWIELSYTFAPDTRTGAMVATAMTVDVDVRALFFVHRNARAESVLVPPAGPSAAP